MEKPKLMKCGHPPLAQDSKGNWVCPMCIGIFAGATEPATNLPDLTGRKAKCSCGREEDSDFSLPFFEYCPDSYDSFYCGHGGWD